MCEQAVPSIYAEVDVLFHSSSLRSHHPFCHSSSICRSLATPSFLRPTTFHPCPPLRASQLTFTLEMSNLVLVAMT